MSKLLIKHGPFTWRKRPPADHGRSEDVWEMVDRPYDIKMTSFCMKDYGGRPDLTGRDAFTGWRLVSGGPFTRVGGWNSFEEALPIITPWLVAYYMEEAQKKIEEANEVIRLVGNFQQVVSAGEHLRGGV